jgi:hypothetical protein
MSRVETYYDNNTQVERGIRLEKRLMLSTSASPKKTKLEIYSE